MAKTFYITTPIFYPNAKLHMGHAYAVTLTDILARYHRLNGEETYFLTGSDENTAKILKNLDGKSTETYLEDLSLNFKDLYKKLSISYDQFIRTTDKEKHWPGAIEMWKRLVEAGDIEKKKYTGLYCIGCETFYMEKDLIDNNCPIHKTVPEKVEEENYFFKLSKYTADIKQKIKNGELSIIPEGRKNEILALLGRGLEDVSFSRPKEKVPHGIPVPGDPEQVIYVWCDALVNYISALGYGRNNSPQTPLLQSREGLPETSLVVREVETNSPSELFDKFWPADVHVIGKDILRFHAAIWPAMLLSAGLPLPKNILVHGMITSGGVKMSKSLGNVIDPDELIKEYGSEAVRYYLARHISPFEDGDLTLESFKEVYNAHLANGLGNLVSRILTLSEKYLEKCPDIPEKSDFMEYFKYYENFEINKAVDYVWNEISELDKYIQETEPFKVIKTDEEKGKKLISSMVLRLYRIARMLNPIMPETNVLLKKLIKENKAPEAPLFARK
ncbi:MAG: methionine--tRNA ligase [Patescibacteria group bacterium]